MKKEYLLTCGGVQQRVRSAAEIGKRGLFLIVVCLLFYSCVQPPDLPQECPQANLAVHSNFKWPGGGHELIVKAENGNGFPWSGQAGCLSIAGDAIGGQSAAEIMQHPLTPGITLLIIKPGSMENVPQYVEAIRGFIENRPEKERIAIYGWGQTLIQISDFTLNRERLLVQLNRISRIALGDRPLSAQAVFDESLEIVKRVEESNLLGMRSVVFVASNISADTIPNTAAGVTTQWVVPQAMSAGKPLGHTIGVRNLAMLKGALIEASERLNQNAAHSFYKIGICSSPNDTGTVTLSDAAGTGIDINLDPSLEGEQDAACDAGQIMSGTRRRLHTINIILTDEELKVYEQRLQDTIELEAKGWAEAIITDYGTAKDRFDIHISLDPSQTPVKATAKFRGQHALFCDRKSYTVNIAGKEARFFNEGAGSDEFYLISMCQDAGLFKGFVGDTLYAQYGLFPLRLHYVEVLLNNETQGVYLIMEKRDEELLKDSARLRGVIRRWYGGAPLSDVEYTSTGNPEDVSAAFEALLVQNVSNADLPAYLRERMDLDLHLYWMGLNSLMQNADTTDECFFVSTESIGPDGNPTDYFRVMSWDPEDIQGLCRSLGLFRADYGLTFCQMNAFERRLIRHPEIFSDYVDILKKLMTEVTPEYFQSVLDQAREQLFPLLERTGVAAALLMPGVEDAATAKQSVQDLMDKSQQTFAARYVELKNNLQAYETLITPVVVETNANSDG